LEKLWKSGFYVQIATVAIDSGLLSEKTEKRECLNKRRGAENAEIRKEKEVCLIIIL